MLILSKILNFHYKNRETRQGGGGGGSDNIMVL